MLTKLDEVSRLRKTKAITETQGIVVRREYEYFTEGKRPLGRRKSRYQENVKMYIFWL
jgi:hypothetical protein